MFNGIMLWVFMSNRWGIEFLIKLYDYLVSERWDDLVLEVFLGFYDFLEKDFFFVCF